MIVFVTVQEWEGQLGIWLITRPGIIDIKDRKGKERENYLMEEMHLRDEMKTYFKHICYDTGRNTSYGLHSLTNDIHLQSCIQLRVALMNHRSL